MEPLALSASALQGSPAGHHHSHLHRQLMHQSWGYPATPTSPAAAMPTPESDSHNSYEASVVAASLIPQSDAWAHHPMLDTPNQSRSWTKEHEAATSAAHDDSGISPGRTSSSGPSSSNGGSPPGAATTRDSEHAPSPPRISVKTDMHEPAEDECRSSPVTHDDDSSETSEDTMDSLSRLQMALSQSGSPLGDIYNSNSEEQQTIQCPLCSHTASSLPSLAAHLNSHVEQRPGNEQSEMLCPMCNHVCSNQEDFVSHLSSHYINVAASQSNKPRNALRRCAVCDFTTKSATKLKSHLAEFHGFAPGDNEIDDDEDVNTPRVNSQGKVKTFRCKQCNFVAVTKLDFWNHTRSHIKGEKMLSCPRCPFVTEYKHHLEYHLRNHSGSKPFKCSQCSYSCVNKSMLNSHLKSHSNVYQYRCSDCNYATKYCHSLKLHLRKYSHQPAMVLNPDGTPNPLPIIDVYGTRRGPKTKKSDQSQQEVKRQRSPVLATGSPYANQPYLANPSPVLPEDQPIHKCAQCDFSTLSQESFAQHLLTAHTNKPAITPPILIPTPEKVIQPQHPLMIQSNPMKEYLQWVYAQQKHAMDLYQQYKTAPLPEPVVAIPTNPLDLTKEIKKPEAETVNNVSNNKNRRKGKAFKLERIVVDDDDPDLRAPLSKIAAVDINENREPTKPYENREPAKPVSPSPPQRNSPEVISVSPKPSPPATDESKSPKPNSDTNGIPPILNVDSGNNNNLPTYNCSYCDIIFRDVVMYTMHMGYHGYKDPFHCNMCGQQTSDKLAFFLHIARSSHC